MYNKIINPNTNRPVNIYSKLGRSIIFRYYNLLKGGSSSSVQAVSTVEPIDTEVSERWKILDACFNERSGNDLPEMGHITNVVLDFYEHLMKNCRIRQKTENKQSINVLCMFAGYGYREAYLFNQLKAMGMKFGKLVIVDQAYKTVSEFEEYQEEALKSGKRFRNTVQCIKDADLFEEIIFCESFKDLSEYLQNIDELHRFPEHGTFDLVLEIHGQYGTAFSFVKDDDNLAHMDRGRQNLDDLNYLISSLNKIIYYHQRLKIPSLNIPVLKLLDTNINTIYFKEYFEDIQSKRERTEKDFEERFKYWDSRSR